MPLHSGLRGPEISTWYRRYLVSPIAFGPHILRGLDEALFGNFGVIASHRGGKLYFNGHCK